MLRSGSRYEKWRKHISSQCEVIGIKLFGQFDNYADVDVFLSSTKEKKQHSVEVTSPWIRNTGNTTKLSDLFDVSVGSVVDNRDPHIGIERPYIISKGLEGRAEFNKPPSCENIKVKMVESPFVVVKRTSRVGDRHRAIATLINIPEPVYIDNHLIVLQPKDGGIASCRKLLKSLKTKSTDEWLDAQIRCRHLTVKLFQIFPYEQSFISKC